jgi:ABC-type multidrug transport system ATPase subunit
MASDIKSRNAIEIHNGYKYYGNPKHPKVVLNNINIFVKYRCIYGLLGESFLKSKIQEFI